MERQLINSCIKYHDGFVGQTIGPTNSLMFHSYKVNVILKNITCTLDRNGHW